MVIQSAIFVAGATGLGNCPDSPWPEIAFAGRSNVGKSSLINTLVNRKRLVKTSSTPGRTQLINFFTVNEQISFVDLPGYGYAKVPLSIKKKWGPMIETYLSKRESLRGVVFIMDVRRTPGQEELNFLDWMKRFGITGIPVLTKTDKFSKTKQIRHREDIAKVLSMDKNELIMFSAKTRQGKNEVWENIEKAAGI